MSPQVGDFCVSRGPSVLLQTYLSHPLTKARQAARTFYVCLSTPFIFNQTYAMQLFPRMNKYIPFPHQLPPDWAISRAFILVMFKVSETVIIKYFILCPYGIWSQTILHWLLALYSYTLCVISHTSFITNSTIYNVHFTAIYGGPPCSQSCLAGLNMTTGQ